MDAHYMSARVRWFSRKKNPNHFGQNYIFMGEWNMKEIMKKKKISLAQNLDLPRKPIIPNLQIGNKIAMIRLGNYFAFMFQSILVGIK